MQDTKINGIFFIQPVWLDGKKCKLFYCKLNSIEFFSVPALFTAGKRNRETDLPEVVEIFS
jgi:hypothetical protein